MGLFSKKPTTEREKVEQRRSEVLAQGRKFKYPMQYAKHKLVINTVTVAVIAIGLMVFAGWTMLYRMQDTGDTIYRLTQVFPVPVAKVDGEKVRYSDYLMIYRSNLETSEKQGGQLGEGADADLVRDGYKEAALLAAVEYTYAMKLAREMHITVTNAEIDEAFNEHRKVGGVERSEESFLKIVHDNFGMTKTEYRRMLYLTLIKAKVTEVLDTPAQETVAKVEQMLVEKENNLAATAEVLGLMDGYEETGQLVDNRNVDGGRSNKAMSMNVGEVSPKFLSSNGDGYFYVKLIERTDTQVNYASLKINFTVFADRIAQLYADNKVEEYITIRKSEQTLTEGQSQGDAGETGDAATNLEQAEQEQAEN